jgi:ubiquinone/menaquinone biosynthesis C-methylase UbiE
LHQLRDRVLDTAALVGGDVPLDVGCGDGLIGFGAVDRVGERGRVIFSDISPHLIAECRKTAGTLAVRDRCDFVVAAATNLVGIQDGSVDVVTTRSVLIYVDDKAGALGEFFRVLRSGGRVCIAEPINQFTFPEPAGVFLGYDVSPVRDAADRLKAFFDREERPRLSAMMDFNERDLLALVERIGFRRIHLDLSIDLQPSRPQPWDQFLKTSGNPLSPTMEEAMAAALSTDARDRLTAHLRPLVESGAGTERRAFAFLRAEKPAA